MYTIVEQCKPTQVPVTQAQTSLPVDICYTRDVQLRAALWPTQCFDAAHYRLIKFMKAILLKLN